MLSSMLSLRDPFLRQTSASCMQKPCGCSSDGKRSLRPAQSRTGHIFFSCYQLKLENPHRHCPPARLFVASLGKEINHGHFCCVSLELLCYSLFDILSRWDQISGMYQRSVIKRLFSFYKKKLVTLKPRIVLLACVHSLNLL